jgi:tetrapyrrole methylase family protein/MazG family protein
MRTQKVTEKASCVGFDWDKTEDVLVKIEEELREFKSALVVNNTDSIREEIGDLLFSLVNLCRFVNVNAEEALSASLAKFIDRFSYIEKKLAEQGISLTEASLKEMDNLWNEAKIKDE